MMVYRITIPPYAGSALSGEGARLYGGRWNPKGWPVVYAAATRSLAVLEMLVQDQPLRRRYSLIPVRLPTDIAVKTLSVNELPYGWRDMTMRHHLQNMGRAWLENNESAVLAVPSVVLPQENNYLLNPRHRDFARLVADAVETLDTDSRLLRATPAP